MFAIATEMSAHDMSSAPGLFPDMRRSYPRSWGKTLYTVTDKIELHPDYVLWIPNTELNTLLIRVWLSYTLQIHINADSSKSRQLSDTWYGTGEDLFVYTEQDWIDFFLRADGQDDVTEKAISNGVHLYSLLAWVSVNKKWDACIDEEAIADVDGCGWMRRIFDNCCRLFRKQTREQQASFMDEHEPLIAKS